MSDWSPAQYRRFADERAQPFHDLLCLVEPGGIRRAVDLGCGPGELTALAARRLATEEMIGIDNSPAMLAEAAAHAGAVPAGGVVRFIEDDIARWTADGDRDLVLAAASLQWVPRHAEVLARWTAALAPGGQLAVQVPANASMPSHTVAAEVASLEPFCSAFGPEGPPVDPVREHVLEPEQYAQLLYQLGFEHQHVRLQVYPHVLPSSRDVVQWVRGTTLTRFQRRLPAELFEHFVAAYESALLAVIGDHAPYFFPFRRVLFCAQLPR